jgi:hypothetical protein
MWFFFHLAACIFWRSAYRGDELGACNYAPNNYFSASQQHPNDWTGYRHPSLKRTSCTETEQNLWPDWCTGLVDLLFVMLSCSWSLHLTEIPRFDLKKSKNIKSAICRRVIKFNWYYFTSWLQFDQCCACLKMWSQLPWLSDYFSVWTMNFMMPSELRHTGDIGQIKNRPGATTCFVGPPYLDPFVLTRIFSFFYIFLSFFAKIYGPKRNYKTTHYRRAPRR